MRDLRILIFVRVGFGPPIFNNGEGPRSRSFVYWASAEYARGGVLAGDNLQSARDHINRAFEHGARLGATTAYLVPQGDDADLFAESLSVLADQAQDAGVKLAVEHFPGSFCDGAVYAHLSRRDRSSYLYCFLNLDTHRWRMKIPGI